MLLVHNLRTSNIIEKDSSASLQHKMQREFLRIKYTVNGMAVKFPSVLIRELPIVAISYLILAQSLHFDFVIVLNFLVNCISIGFKMRSLPQFFELVESYVSIKQRMDVFNEE